MAGSGLPESWRQMAPDAAVAWQAELQKAMSDIGMEGGAHTPCAFRRGGGGVGCLCPRRRLLGVRAPGHWRK